MKFASSIARTACLLFAAAAAVAAPAAARTPAAAPVFWREATSSDLRAAFNLIEENHPGAVPSLGDTRFRDNLASAYRTARSRLAKVRDYDGYQAVLAGFADALGDKHIWSRPTYVIERPNWSGLLVSKRAGKWTVAVQGPESGAPPLVGAELIRCDGKSAEAMAVNSLAKFRVNWSIGAQQIQAAPWLLVDEHNPFVHRPTRCDFEKGGTTRTIALKWSTIHRQDLLEKIKRVAGSGSAGFGTRTEGGGIWIALGNLLDAAAPVVEDVERRSRELRQAPFVIVDVRGNGGGSSIFGTRVAEALWGGDYVNSRLNPGSADECTDQWRASDANIAQLKSYLRDLGPSRGTEFVKIVTGMIADAVAARSQGKPWIIPEGCLHGVPTTPAGGRSKAAYTGPVLLLTDNRCFSSCLALTQQFRQLGAIQIGQTTDANTHYSEVREILLPSGLSYFSTLQAFSPGTPRQLGPFEPAYPYPGDIADDLAVVNWATAIARRLSEKN